MIVSEVMTDAREILGKCSDEFVFRRLTDAISTLAVEGDWTPMLGFVDICTTSDCRSLTLPNDVETPLAVNVGGAPKIFRNKWYEFHLNGMGSFQQSVDHWDDAGYFPVVMDILTYSHLIAIADSKNDRNAILRVFGTDRNGYELRVQNPDGVWEAGVPIPIGLLSDYALGIITPDTTRIFPRTFTAAALDTFYSATPHQLTTGAKVRLDLSTPPLPTELTDAGTYYVRAESATTVKLYETREEALADSNAISLASVDPLFEFKLTDRRGVGVLTQFESTTDHNMTTGMPVSFTATTIPTGLVEDIDYYARVIDATNFTVHETEDNANDNVDPIDVSDVGAAVVARAKQALAPRTYCRFLVRHNFITGDYVRAENSTGVLPAPLQNGSSYYIGVLDSYTISLHTTLTDALAGTSPIVLTSAGTGTHQLVKSIACSVAVGTASNCVAVNHNLTLTGGDLIQFTTDGVFPTPLAQGTVYTAEPPMSVNTLTIKSLVAELTGVTITGGGAGYTNADGCTITEVGGATARGVLTVAAGAITAVTITDGGAGFTVSNALTITGDTPGGAGATATVGSVSNDVNITSLGTGQLYLNVSRVFILDFFDTWKTDATELATGNEVKLESTLTLPATNPAVSPATTYYARVLDDETISLFTTAAYAADTAIRTSVDRARASNVATITTSAAHGLVNGDYVDISGLALELDGVLSVVTVTGGGAGYVDGDGCTLTEAGGQTARGTLTVAAGVITAITVTNGGSGFTVGNALTIVDDLGGGAAATATVGAIVDNVDNSGNTYNAERVQVTVTGATTFTYASVGLDEPTTADVAGQIVISAIKVNALGTGVLRLVFERSVAPVLFNSLLKLSDETYLADGVTVQFETTGTLPAPLAVATNYIIRRQSDPRFIQVYTAGGVAVTLNSIGSGYHNMTIAADFLAQLGYDINVVNNEYTTGDALEVDSTGTPPPPLVDGTTYYARRIDADTIELYDTEAHALDTTATTGRVEPTGVGAGTHTLLQTLPNWEISKITDVVKSETNGTIHLYAWDYGRTDNLTILGHYGALETNPRYRRIKLGSACSWVRMRYKRKTFTITTLDDFIPLNNKMAVLFMLRALELMRNNFTDKSKEFYDKAVTLLNKEQTRSDGPSGLVIQVNSNVFGTGTSEGVIT